MTKEEVFDLIADAGFGFLATLENEQPRVRPMMPYLTEEGDMLLAVLSTSRTIEQVKENPRVEICYVDRKMAFCRVSGTAKISDSLDKKAVVFENVPMLRQYFGSPEDPNFVLIEIDTGSVEAMAPHQKKPDVLSLK